VIRAVLTVVEYGRARAQDLVRSKYRLKYSMHKIVDSKGGDMHWRGSQRTQALIAFAPKGLDPQVRFWWKSSGMLAEGGPKA
jgi:hypothetical protein